MGPHLDGDRFVHLFRLGRRLSLRHGLLQRGDLRLEFGHTLAVSVLGSGGLQRFQLSLQVGNPFLVRGYLLLGLGVCCRLHRCGLVGFIIARRPRATMPKARATASSENHGRRCLCCFIAPPKVHVVLWLWIAVTWPHRRCSLRWTSRRRPPDAQSSVKGISCGTQQDAVLFEF